MKLDRFIPHDYPYSLEETEKIFSMFMMLYKFYMGKEHPQMTDTTVQEIIDLLPTDGTVEYKVEDYPLLMKAYFRTDFRDCNYALRHFVSGKIRFNRLRTLGNA